MKWATILKTNHGADDGNKKLHYGFKSKTKIQISHTSFGGIYTFNMLYNVQRSKVTNFKKMPKSILSGIFLLLLFSNCNIKSQRIPIIASRWYQQNYTSEGLAALFDGEQRFESIYRLEQNYS